MADGTGDPVTEYVLTADFFDQIVERRPDRTALRIVKHRRGAILDDLTDAEAERLLSTGAIKPYVEPEPVIDEEEDNLGDGEDLGDGDGDDLGEGEDGGDSPAADEAAQPVPAQPKKTASTEEWRGYAVLRGMPEAEAAEATRADLIAKFGD